MPRAKDIAIYLIGSENHKARPDLRDDSGFWLRVETGDAPPFIAVFADSADVFHEFAIEQRVGKEIRRSTFSAQIVEIEEGLTESRILLRPHPSIAAVLP